MSLNGVKLVGAKHDVASIAMAQDLITSYTKKMQHLEELPKRTVKKINAHIEDIQHHLTRIHAYDANGTPVTSFPFTRQVIDDTGNAAAQVVV